MSGQAYVFPRGIKTSNEYIKKSISNIKTSYSGISSCVSGIERNINELNSLNNSIYYENGVKKRLNVSVSGNYQAVFSKIKSSHISLGVEQLGNSKIFNLDQVANDLDSLINKMIKELGVNNSDVRTLFFGDVRSREKGLDPLIMKDGLSDDSIKALRDYWNSKSEKKLTDDEFNDKLSEFFKDVSAYSKGNGCGGYSILSLINYKYKNALGDNISKEKFFGEILIQSNLNSKEQSVYKYNKLDNLMKTIKAKSGPLNTKEMANICDYLNNNRSKYKIDKIDYSVVENISGGNSFKDSAAAKELKKTLDNGGSAVVMLKRIEKKSNNTSSTAVVPSEKNAVDSTEAGREWANSRHYVTLSHKRSDGSIGVIDSRDFNTDDMVSSSKDWSNLRKENINNITNYIQEKTKDDAEKIGYTSGQGGIILFK